MIIMIIEKRVICAITYTRTHACTQCIKVMLPASHDKFPRQGDCQIKAVPYDFLSFVFLSIHRFLALSFV
jgi:hypothetical protein